MKEVRRFGMFAGVVECDTAVPYTLVMIFYFLLLFATFLTLVTMESIGSSATVQGGLNIHRRESGQVAILAD